MLLLIPLFNVGFGCIVFVLPLGWKNLSMFSRVFYFFVSVTLQPLITALALWAAVRYARCHEGRLGSLD